MKVVLLHFAKNDLEEIRSYLTKESPQASKLVGEKIKKSLSLLSENPYIGSIKDNEDILEWHIPGIPYTLPYRIVGDQIQILRVFHEAQNKPSKWEISKK
jgi:addiction module RelE/StbE family toxin